MLLVATVLAVVATRLTGHGGGSAAAAPLRVGSTVPDFTLPLTTGQTFRLSAERGHVVVVYAMATWCGTCVPGSQTMAQIYPRYHARGVDVLMVSVDPQDTPQTIAAFQG